MHSDSASSGTLPNPSGSSISAKRQNSDTQSQSVNPPQRISTPPPPSERGRHDSKVNANVGSDRRLRGGVRTGDVRTSAFDPDALDQALSRELQRPQRESTPGASPHRKRQRINGDRLVLDALITILCLLIFSPRFIPTRSGQDLQASFSLLHEEGSPATPSKQKKRTPHGELHFQKSKLSTPPRPSN